VVLVTISSPLPEAILESLHVLAINLYFSQIVSYLGEYYIGKHFASSYIEEMMCSISNNVQGKEYLVS